MPKNKVSHPITDQEMAFALLVLSGAMTDCQAAEAVGLNPDSTAYTKSKPHVRAYMLQHRAAVQQQLAQQEADLSRPAVDGQHRLSPDREQVLDRLWEIASLSPEMTRGSVTGQVKSLSIIVAMQNFIPDRLAVARLAESEKKSTPATNKPEIYASAWLRQQQATTPGTTNDRQPTAAPHQGEDQPARPSAPSGLPDPDFAPASAGVADPDPGQSTLANPFTPSEAPPVTPYVPFFASVLDKRMGFSIKKNPFARPR
jgi:hypothetical protein